MENKLPIIDGVEWQPTVTRNMSFWHQCLSVEGSYKHQGDFGVDSQFDYLSLTVDGVHTTAFGYAENLREMGVAVLAAVNSDTKIATQVLRDGDDVEVDADKGIVGKV